MQTRSRSLPVAFLLAGTIRTPALAEDAQAVRLDHPSVAVTMALGSAETFEERPTVLVYFKRSGTGEPSTPFPDENGKFSDLPVFLVRSATGAPLGEGIGIESCTLEGAVAANCSKADFSARIPKSQKFLELTLGRRVDVVRSILRMRLAPGGFELCAASDSPQCDPSPAVETSLPTLSKGELAYVQSRPRFRMDLTPLARDTSAPTRAQREAAALDFEVALFRDRGRSRLGVTGWGHVATQEDLSFDQLGITLGAEHNLLRGDFLPLAIHAKAESDQALEVVDVSAEMRVRFILPIHLNLSPLDAFVPVLGPRVSATASVGQRVRGSLEPQKDFARAGYEVVWRVPTSANGLVRFHHAGTWILSELTGTDERFNVLWDIALEQKLGEVTYFVGYQRGSAAPLFKATETTRAGFVLRFN